MSYNVVDRKHFVWNMAIDRLYLEFMKGKWEFALGRQRINWGIASFWNPNDLFNTVSFTDFDHEEGPGSDAARITFYPNVKHSIQLAGKAADSWDKAVVALLYKTYWKTFDLQFLLGRFKTNYAVGGGWAGNLKNAGFKGEWAIFIPQDRGVPTEWNITGGVDYGIKNGMYINTGYLYSSIAKDVVAIPAISGFDIDAKNLYPFRHNLYAVWMYPATPLFNVSITAIFSPVSDLPFFLMPVFTYSMAENWDLDLISQILLGDNSGQYKAMVHGYFFRIKFSY